MAGAGRDPHRAGILARLRPVLLLVSNRAEGPLLGEALEAVPGHPEVEMASWLGIEVSPVPGPMPPINRVDSHSVLEAALRRLTRSSVSDPDSP